MKGILVAVGVGIIVLLGSPFYDELCNVWRVSETSQPRNKGIQNSLLGGQLSRYWWLGPVRGNTLRGPEKDSTHHAGRPWWVLLLKAYDTKLLLGCLDDSNKAGKTHKAFSKAVMWFGVFYVLVAMGLYGVRLIVFKFLFPNILSSLPTRYWETTSSKTSGRASSNSSLSLLGLNRTDSPS